MTKVHMTYTDYLESEINEYKKEVADLTSKLEEYKKREEIIDKEMTKLDKIYEILNDDGAEDFGDFDEIDDICNEIQNIIDMLILHPELTNEF